MGQKLETLEQGQQARGCHGCPGETQWRQEGDQPLIKMRAWNRDTETKGCDQERRKWVFRHEQCFRDIKRLKRWGKVSDLRALLPFTLPEMFNRSSVVDLGGGDCGQEYICLLHHCRLRAEEAIVPSGPLTTVHYCWIILKCLKIKWVVYCHYWNRLLEISVCPKLGHTHMDTHTCTRPPSVWLARCWAQAKLLPGIWADLGGNTWASPYTYLRPLYLFEDR